MQGVRTVDGQRWYHDAPCIVDVGTRIGGCVVVERDTLSHWVVQCSEGHRFVRDACSLRRSLRRAQVRGWRMRCPECEEDSNG